MISFFFAVNSVRLLKTPFLSCFPPPSLPLYPCVFTYSVGCLAGCGLVSCDASLVTEFLDINRGHQVVGVESWTPFLSCSPPSLPLYPCVFTYSVGFLAWCGLVSRDASLVTEFLETNHGHQIVSADPGFFNAFVLPSIALLPMFL